MVAGVVHLVAKVVRLAAVMPQLPQGAAAPAAQPGSHHEESIIGVGMVMLHRRCCGRWRGARHLHGVHGFHVEQAQRHTPGEPPQTRGGVNARCQRCPQQPISNTAQPSKGSMQDGGPTHLCLYTPLCVAVLAVRVQEPPSADDATPPLLPSRQPPAPAAA